MMMRTLALCLVLAACGSTPPPPAHEPEPVAGPKDTRTPIERRRDAACEGLAPKITACAVEDAKKNLAAGKITQKQFDQDTAAAVQKKNSEEFVAHCEVPMSSRQVRVLEVCPAQETECEPLLACLDNLNKK